MKHFQVIILITLIFSLMNCSQKQDKGQDRIKENFADNDHLLDSISKVFNSEKITLDKWEEESVTDSTFSLTIINAKQVPNRSNIDSSVTLFKALAKAAQQALKNGAKYNSYQIVFVKTDTINGQVNKLHESGMTIKNNEIR